MKHQQFKQINWLLLIVIPCFIVIKIMLANRAPTSIEDAATAHSPRDQIAFHGARGFGAYARGGINGRILIVNSLEDSSKDGTLRWAIEQPYPRIIRFTVGGTIALQKNITIRNPQVTIDGSTAPFPGITLTNGTVYINNTYDIIMRHIRIRPIDNVSKKGVVQAAATRPNMFHEAIHIKNSAYIMIDHCSASWSRESLIRMVDSSFITIQNCLIGEQLPSSSNIPMIWTNGFEISFVENLFASCPHVALELSDTGKIVIEKTEQEQFRDVRVSLANNIIALYGTVGTEITISEPSADFHIRDNLYKFPRTENAVAITIKSGYKKPVELTDPLPSVKMLIEGNIAPTRPSNILPEWRLVRSEFSDTITNSMKSDAQLFRSHNVVPLPPEQLELYIPHHVGATLPKRDATDSRIINNALLGKKST